MVVDIRESEVTADSNDPIVCGEIIDHRRDLDRGSHRRGELLRLEGVPPLADATPMRGAT